MIDFAKIGRLKMESAVLHIIHGLIFLMIPLFEFRLVLFLFVTIAEVL